MIFRRDILKGLGSLFGLSFSSFDLGHLYGRKTTARGVPAGELPAPVAPANLDERFGRRLEWNGIVIEIQDYYYSTFRSSHSDSITASLAVIGRVMTCKGPIREKIEGIGDSGVFFRLDGNTVIRGEKATSTSIHMIDSLGSGAVEPFTVPDGRIYASFTFTVIP